MKSILLRCAVIALTLIGIQTGFADQLKYTLVNNTDREQMFYVWTSGMHDESAYTNITTLEPHQSIGETLAASYDDQTPGVVKIFIKIPFGAYQTITFERPAVTSGDNWKQPSPMSTDLYSVNCDQGTDENCVAVDHGIKDYDNQNVTINFKY